MSEETRSKGQVTTPDQRLNESGSTSFQTRLANFEFLVDSEPGNQYSIPVPPSCCRNSRKGPSVGRKHYQSTCLPQFIATIFATHWVITPLYPREPRKLGRSFLYHPVSLAFTHIQSGRRRKKNKPRPHLSLGGGTIANNQKLMGG
jgi:hypothetical protein